MNKFRTIAALLSCSVLAMSLPLTALTAEASDIASALTDEAPVVSAESNEYAYNDGNIQFNYTVYSDGIDITKFISSADGSVVIPETIDGSPVTSIGPEAFIGSENVQSVVLPESLMYISDFTFCDCDQLESVWIDKNVAYIGTGAFAEASALTEINLSELNTSYAMYDGILYTEDYSTLVACPADKIENTWFSVDILPIVHSIASYSFAGCKFLSEVNIPDSVTTIGDCAFAGCKALSFVRIPETVGYIGDYAFTDIDYIVARIYNSDCHIGDYAFGDGAHINAHRGSTAETFAMENNILFESFFEWGYDNWAFINEAYSDIGGFEDVKNVEQFDEDTYIKMIENLDNAEYDRIFLDQTDIYGMSTPAMANKYFGGECRGMSAMVLLAKKGYVKYSDFKIGASCLNDLDKPIDNKKVASAIMYFQLLQENNLMNENNENFMDSIGLFNYEFSLPLMLHYIDQNNIIMISYGHYDWGSHSVVGYDYSKNIDYTYNGRTYDSCIYICDPNSSTGYDEFANLYFDSATYDWVVPAYSDWVSSDAGGYIMNIEYDDNIINYQGIFGNWDSEYASTVTRIGYDHVRQPFVVTSEDDFRVECEVGDPSYPYEENSRNSTYYQNMRSFKLSGEMNDYIKVHLDSPDGYALVEAKSANAAVLSRDGMVSVDGSNCDYHLVLTQNHNCPTEWFTFDVRGYLKTHAEMKLTKVKYRGRSVGGYVLSSDDMRDVSLVCHNRYDEVGINFSTTYTSVAVLSPAAGCLCVMADADKDGEYETLIAANVDKIPEPEALNLGDVNGDGEYSPNDASLALTIYSCRSTGADTGMYPEQELAADADEDGDVDTSDASYILGYYSYLSTTNDKQPMGIRQFIKNIKA